MPSRVGATQRYLARLAASSPGRLARQIRADSVGVRGNHSSNLAGHERVELIVNDAASEKLARKTLSKANALNENVCFRHWSTNRVWTRDSGCTFVMCLDLLRRTAEGGCPTRFAGRQVAFQRLGQIFQLAAGETRRLAALWRRPPEPWNCARRLAKKKQRVVLEGGSIDVNGRGTLLTTEECLLRKVQQRNPGMKRADYAKVFAEHLGIKNVVWLGLGGGRRRHAWPRGRYHPLCFPRHHRDRNRIESPTIRTTSPYAKTFAV